MEIVPATKASERLAKYADMFSAMGTEPRLRIMQLLLTAHPDGLVVSDIQAELKIPNSILSHHLDKLRTEGLVEVQRESTFLRYTANAAALQELLQFLYAECCTRNKAVKPEQIIQICKLGAVVSTETSDIKEAVKQKYGEAALRVKSGGSSCCGAVAATGCCDPITTNLYDASHAGQIPPEALLASPAVAILLRSPN